MPATLFHIAAIDADSAAVYASLRLQMSLLFSPPLLPRRHPPLPAATLILRAYFALRLLRRSG